MSTMTGSVTGTFFGAPVFLTLHAHYGMSVWHGTPTAPIGTRPWFTKRDTHPDAWTALVSTFTVNTL